MLRRVAHRLPDHRDGTQAVVPRQQLRVALILATIYRSERQFRQIHAACASWARRAASDVTRQVAFVAAYRRDVQLYRSTRCHKHLIPAWAGPPCTLPQAA